MARSSSDQAAWVARAPLAATVADYLSGDGALSLRALAIRAGVDKRMVHKIVHGDGAWVRLDTADRLLWACGRLDELSELDVVVAA